MRAFYVLSTVRLVLDFHHVNVSHARASTTSLLGLRQILVCACLDTGQILIRQTALFALQSVLPVSLPLIQLAPFAKHMLACSTQLPLLALATRTTILILSFALLATQLARNA